MGSFWSRSDRAPGVRTCSCFTPIDRKEYRRPIAARAGHAHHRDFELAAIPWARTTLVPSGSIRTLIDLRDAKKGWDRGLTKKNFIIADSLAARRPQGLATQRLPRCGRRVARRTPTGAGSLISSVEGAASGVPPQLPKARTRQFLIEKVPSLRGVSYRVHVPSGDTIVPTPLPITFTAARNMLMKRSIPRMRAIPATGIVGTTINVPTSAMKEAP